MWFEIILLSAVIAFLLSIVWSTARTGMSPMPSSKAARAAMMLALEKTHGSVADLGSGWGHLALTMAKRYPDRNIVGYEVSWLPWLVSVLLKRAMGLSNLRLYRRNFQTAITHGELAQVHVILCYLHASGMASIAESLDTHLLPPKGQLRWLISNNFALPEHEPERRWRLQDFYRSPVYRYRLTKRQD